MGSNNFYEAAAGQLSGGFLFLCLRSVPRDQSAAPGEAVTFRLLWLHCIKLFYSQAGIDIAVDNGIKIFWKNI